MAKELSRKELFDLVWAESMLALSKKFEISDVGLRKICKKFNIPVPKRGHWQRIKAGRKVSKPTLPVVDSDEKISLVEMDRPMGKKVYPWTQRQIEIENDTELNLVVPSKLDHPDDLIVETKRILSEKDFRRGGLNINVQRNMLSRAFLFMDTFIKLLRARGHSIEVNYDETYAIIREQRVKIQLRERSKIIDVPSNSWSTRDFIPTGIMVFKSDGYGSYEWQDGKRQLEEQLSNILAKIETKINELHECWRINRIREEEENKRLQIQKEKEQRKQQELRDFKAWKVWALKKADWYDPYLEVEDALLLEVDKEKLSMPKTLSNFQD